MLELREVSKSFGRVQAVRGVSFRLEPGEVAGLLGPNGAGKTTTIRMITGFLPPDAGDVTVAGHDTVTDSLNARRQIGYLPESAPLYPEMTPRRYLDFRGRLFRMPKADRTAAIGRAIERCWLGDVADRRIGQLSKGYRQRVGLAAALLHDPRVLVLDEPTNALDPTQVRETRRLIRDLAKDRVVLLSSHILAEVELTCSRVVVIARGRMLADGRPTALLAGRGGAYRVEWKSTGEPVDQSIITAVKTLAGVAEVRSEPGDGVWRGMLIEPGTGAGTDLREAIAGIMQSAGVLVRTLQREGATLERLFVELVEDAGPARGAA